MLSKELLGISERLEHLFEVLLFDVGGQLAAFEEELKGANFESKDAVLENFKASSQRYGLVFQSINAASEFFEAFKNNYGLLNRDWPYLTTGFNGLINIDFVEASRKVSNLGKEAFSKDAVESAFVAVQKHIATALSAMEVDLFILRRLCKKEVPDALYKVHWSLTAASHEHARISTNWDLFKPLSAKLESATANAMYDLIYTMPNILTFPREFSPNGESVVTMLALQLRFNSSVTDVDFSGLKLGKHAVNNLAYGLCRNSTVRTLKLTDCGLDDKAMSVLCKIFKRRTKSVLRSLDVSENNLTIDSVTPICDALLPFPIKSLKISFFGNAQTAIQNLFSGLCGNTSITSLGVTNELVTKALWQEISEFISANRKREKTSVVTRDLRRELSRTYVDAIAICP